jgi:hypothetical protein
MDGLIQLVADSFIRHGIESPAVGDSLTSQTIRSAEPTLPTAVPEHAPSEEQRAPSCARAAPPVRPDVALEGG